jgi:peptidoglycan/LPS O-acetylase OafA/YrhL
MRPLKQLGVLSTHSLGYLAPTAVSINACVTLTHVSKEGFFFISACMATYAYQDLTSHDLGRFWHRRLVNVGLPYLCWTLIYFLIGLPSFSGSAPSAAAHFGYLLLTGYYQLYFLVVLLEFYVLFPAFLWLLRKTQGHHVALFMVSLAVQACYTAALHWRLLPEGTIGTRDVMSYQLYLVAGCLTAVHYQAVNRWLVDHARLVVVATVCTAALAEGWYWLQRSPGFGFLGSPADTFHPIDIPFNLAGIALIYLVGVSLVSPRRSTTMRRATRVGSDNSYTIYLSQVVFFQILLALGWKHLDHVVPWPIDVAGAITIVFLAACLLGGLLARTPLAMPLAGRHRVSWASLRPWWLERRLVDLASSPSIARHLGQAADGARLDRASQVLVSADLAEGGE